MASLSLSEDELRETYELYNIGYQCGLEADDTLLHVLNSCRLDKGYLKKFIEIIPIRKDPGMDLLKIWHSKSPFRI